MEEPEDLPAAIEQLKRCRELQRKSEAETQSVRLKLHSAVRKGKAIEVERASLFREVQVLAQQLQLARSIEVTEEHREHLNQLQTDSKGLSSELDGAKLCTGGEDLLAQLKAAKASLTNEVEQLREKQQVDTAEELAKLQSQHQLHLESVLSKHDIELSEQRARLEEERAEILKVVGQGEADIAAAMQTSQDLEHELQRMQQSQADAEKQHSEQVHMMQQQLETLQMQLTDANEAANAASMSNANMKSKMDTIWQRCMELEDVVEQQHTRRLQGTEYRSDQACLADEAGEDLKQQIVRLEGKLAAAEAKIESSAEAKSLPEEGLNAARVDVEKMKHDADVMREALQAAAVRIQEAQDSELHARSLAEERDEEAAALRKQLAKLEGILSVQKDLEVELSKTRESLSEARDECAKAHSGLMEASAENELSRHRVVELQQELQAALESNNAQVDQADELQKAAAKEASEIKEEASRQLEAAREAKEAAGAQWSAAEVLRLEAEKSVTEAKAEAAAAKAAMEKLQAEEAARKQRFGLLQSTFAKEKGALQRQVDSLSQQMATQLEALRQQKEALRDEQERTRIAEEEAESTKQACTAAKQRISELKQLLENSQADAILAEAKESAEEAASHAQELEAELESSKATRRGLEAELEAAKKELALAGSRVQEVEHSLSEAREQLENITRAGQNGHYTRAPQQHNATTMPSRDPEGARPDAEGPAGKLVSLEEQIAALESENAGLRSRAREQDKRIAAAGAVQHAKLASLEKQNQELQWQVAMLTRDPEAPPQRPKAPQQLQGGLQEAPGGETLPKLVGLLLRHRRGLLVGYFAILHVLLYILLQARGHASSTCVPAGKAALESSRHLV